MEITEETVADFLQSLKTQARQITTPLQAQAISADLEEVAHVMQQHPHTITEKTIALLGEMALASPHKDRPGSEMIRRSPNPRQEICFHALRAMVPLIWAAPGQGPAIIEELEHILNNGQDWQIGREALFALAAPCTVEGEALNKEVIKALVRQGRENIYAPLRATARDLLLLASREHEEVVLDALAAQKNGLQDEAPECRMRAIEMLTHRAVSVSSSENEARSLRDIFKAIALDSSEEPEVREQAAHASMATGKRLGKGIILPPFPR